MAEVAAGACSVLAADSSASSASSDSLDSAAPLSACCASAARAASASACCCLACWSRPTACSARVSACSWALTRSPLSSRLAWVTTPAWSRSATAGVALVVVAPDAAALVVVVWAAPSRSVPSAAAARPTLAASGALAEANTPKPLVASAAAASAPAAMAVTSRLPLPEVGSCSLRCAPWPGSAFGVGGTPWPRRFVCRVKVCLSGRGVRSDARPGNRVSCPDGDQLCVLSVTEP